MAESTPATGEPSPAAAAVADPGLELAYTAALKAVEQQDSTLGNLRNRAAGLLSAVTIATTFGASLGLFSSDPTKGTPLADWAKWLLLALLIAVGTLSMAVMWPVNIAFGVDARKVLAQRDKDPGIDSIRSYLITELVAGHGRNQKAVVKKFHYYQGAILALTVETAALVLALILKG